MLKPVQNNGTLDILHDHNTLITFLAVFMDGHAVA